ncbi:MAG: nucleotidyltransferase family protein [Candidatus Methanomethylicaceae archaeon]
MAKEKTTTRARSLDNILATLRDHLPELRERYGVTSLGVFGPYVQGRQRKRSDMDVLVEFGHAPTLFRFIDLQEELSALLGVKVDLVSRKALNGEIGRRILEEVIAL